MLHILKVNNFHFKFKECLTTWERPRRWSRRVLRSNLLVNGRFGLAVGARKMIDF